VEGWQGWCYDEPLMQRGGGYNVSITKSPSLDGVGPENTHWGILKSDDQDIEINTTPQLHTEPFFLFLIEIRGIK